MRIFKANTPNLQKHMLFALLFCGSIDAYKVASRCIQTSLGTLVPSQLEISGRIRVHARLSRYKK
jgi:hypothetical protein